MSAALLRPGDAAPSLELRSDGGGRIELSELWGERSLALFFVRHFG